MYAEKLRNHGAFFDYCDRWMTEDHTEHVKPLEALMHFLVKEEAPSAAERQKLINVLGRREGKGENDD